jgi:hypothetical protein
MMTHKPKTCVSWRRYLIGWKRRTRVNYITLPTSFTDTYKNRSNNIVVDKLSTLMSDNKILFGVADPSTCQCHVPSTCPETHTYTVLYPRRHESSINKNFWQSSLLQTWACMVRLKFTFTICTIQWSTSVHDLHYDIFHAHFARHSIHYLYPCHAWTVDMETNQDSIYDN